MNPHRSGHTPGGSSSGSAAAVAAGMADLALGTQTAGSVIRPASFCGVFGYKPTYGLVPTAGVKQAAPSLDTVGVFGRDLALVDSARRVLTRQAGTSRQVGLRFAFVRTEQWDHAEPDCRAVIEQAAAAARAEARDLPVELVGLAEDQPKVQAHEGVGALAWERSFRADQLSEGLRRILDWGASITAEENGDVRRRVQAAQAPAVVERLFGDADVIVTPAVVGEAPAGLDSTGDPRFCRLWTLLGLPALSVPGLVGATGLPIGVQLVARPHADGTLLAGGAVLAGALARVAHVRGAAGGGRRGTP